MPSAINLSGPLGPEQFRNKLVNGDFNFWQRGTSSTVGGRGGEADGQVNAVYSVSNTYVTDRWFLNASLGRGVSGEYASDDYSGAYEDITASVPTISIKRQGFTLGYPEQESTITDVEASTYYNRVTIGAAKDSTADEVDDVAGVTGAMMDVGNSYIQFGQHVDVNWEEFSNKTAWLSFVGRSFGLSEAKIGCNLSFRPDFSDTRTTIDGEGEVFDNVVPSTTTGVTGDARNNDALREIRIVGDDIVLTNEWQKFKRKFIMPSFANCTLGTDGVSTVTPAFTLAAGASGTEEYLAKTAISDFLALNGATGAFDVGQIQLEIGDDISPFEKRHSTIELSMCQRYYQSTLNLHNDYSYTVNKTYGSNSTFQTTMRTTPSCVKAELHSIGTAFGSISTGDVYITEKHGFGTSKTCISSTGDSSFAGIYTFDAEL